MPPIALRGLERGREEAQRCGRAASRHDDLAAVPGIEPQGAGAGAVGDEARIVEAARERLVDRPGGVERDDAFIGMDEHAVVKAAEPLERLRGARGFEGGCRMSRIEHRIAGRGLRGARRLEQRQELRRRAAAGRREKARSRERRARISRRRRASHRDGLRGKPRRAMPPSSSAQGLEIGVRRQ